MSDFTTTFDNESFINSEISNNENIKSSLNAEEVIENSLDVVEETTSELNSQSGMNSLLDVPMVHRYNGEISDNIDVLVDNEKHKISATLKQIRFKTSNDFPEVGSEKLIYIANDTKEIFGWDDSKGYFKIKVGETYDDSEIRAEIELLKENKVDNAELGKYYTKEQVDDILAGGSVDVDLSDYYKKNETYSQQEVNGLLNNKANKSEIPFVGNFITRAVDDLVNYYTKEETYTQAEVRQLVSSIPKFSVEVVTGFPANPSKTTLYLLKTSATETGNLYTEYIYVNGVWEKLGTQKLDLSGYVTTEELTNALKTKQDLITIDNMLGSDAVYDGNQINKFVTEEDKSYWNSKVDVTVSDLVNYYKKSETYTKEEVDVRVNLLDTNKANKTDLDDYVTDEELEGKGYLTSIPSKFATKLEDNWFQTSQSIIGDIYLANDNASILAPLGSTEIGLPAPFIRVIKADNVVEIGSELVDKVTSPNIIQAQGLTDGTTTKTMTEILEGGGVTLRRWS